MWLYAFMLACGALGALIIHELAHLLGARALGVNAVKITIGLGPIMATFTDRFGTSWQLALLPIGAVCGFPDGPASQPVRLGQRRSIRSLTPGRRAIIVLAGPLTNPLLAGALFLATYTRDSNFSIAQLGRTDATLSFLVGSFSLAIALFNLLPVFPLDGGQLVLLAFQAITGREVSRETEKRLFAFGLILMFGSGAFAALLFAAAPYLVPG